MVAKLAAAPSPSSLLGSAFLRAFSCCLVAAEGDAADLERIKLKSSSSASLSWSLTMSKPFSSLVL